MPQYVLTQPDPDPIPEGFSPTVFLRITTDDAGMIVVMSPPHWRASDAVITTLVRNWQNFLGEGSPLPEATIFVFEEFLIQTYGGAMYTVRRRS